MKTILILLALLTLCSVSYGQPFQRETAVRNISTGAVWTAKAFATSTSDTTQGVDLKNWVYSTLIIKTLDSSVVTVNFQPSFDGINFDAKIAIGSAWTNVVNAGATKGFDIPAGYNGMRAVRWVIDWSGACGFTTPTFSAVFVQKR